MNDSYIERPIDETAQRILNLMFIFNTAARPLSTEEIVSDSDLGYGSANRDSDKKKFRRDREKLEERGFIIKNVQPQGANENEESLWALDRDATFAVTGAISTDDADTLCAAIDTCVMALTPALAVPLKHIREKVAACGQLEQRDRNPSDIPDTTPAQEAVWSAFAARKALTFMYVNAKGEEKKRTVEIYGMFSQRGASYFCGLDSVSQRVRTFRTDRIAKAWNPTKPYAIPDDFNVEEHMFLPFDFSEHEPRDATFAFPAGMPASEVDAIRHHRGTVETDPRDGTWRWHVAVRDIAAAARFALGHASRGMRPKSPQPLIEAWNKAIDEAVTINGEA